MDIFSPCHHLRLRGSVIGDPTWLWGIIFGIVHGIIAVVTMPMMKDMHTRPEHADIEMGAMTVVGMLMGHASLA